MTRQGHHDQEPVGKWGNGDNSHHPGQVLNEETGETLMPPKAPIEGDVHPALKRGHSGGRCQLFSVRNTLPVSPAESLRGEEKMDTIIL